MPRDETGAVRQSHRRRATDALDEDEVRARAFWSGTITFGLVSIPVNLFPANRSQRVSLRMLAPDGTPLRRRYYDPETGKDVPPEEIVRGYELDDGRFVLVSDDELEALAPERSRDIDLRRFVPAEQIDPILFERAYFLTPGGESTKAYRLLAETMEKRGRAGIATFVMRGKEYLVAILAENGILRAETLRFADEVRAPEAVGLPGTGKGDVAARRRLEKTIRKLEKPDIETTELEDDAARRLIDLVRRKKRKGEDVVAPEPVEEEEEEAEAGVIDLMQVIKQSLRAAEGKAKRPKRAARRRAAGQRAATTVGGNAAARGDRAAPSAAELKKETKTALYERAQDLDIPGRSAMSKQELIAAIRKAS